MLALKTILARLDRVPTLVFDEVDAGIGGRVGLQVGDTMRRVASDHQVFAITHLPQIAARAHHHIVVSKGARSGVTTADVSIVADDERVAEIARMLGGDPESATSRAHAKELLVAEERNCLVWVRSRVRASRGGSEPCLEHEQELSHEPDDDRASRDGSKLCSGSCSRQARSIRDTAGATTQKAALLPAEIHLQHHLIPKRFGTGPAAPGERLEMAERHLERQPSRCGIADAGRRI